MNDMPALTGLSNRDPVKLLMSEARYKPDLLRIIEDIDNISVEEIDSLPQLIWRKEALKKLKRQKIEKERQAEAAEAAQTYADQMGQITVKGPVYGALHRYIGPDFEYKPPKGLAVTITMGTELFVTDGLMWMDNIMLGSPNITTEVIRENITRADYVGR